MTRIVIVAFGTRGDVTPLTGLGVRLRDRLGVDVAIAAQRPYEQLVESAGLPFRPLPGDTEGDTRASAYGQAVVDGTRMRPSKAVLTQMRDDLSGVGEAMAVATADADLLLLEGPVGALLGYHVAEALELPSIGAFLQPVSPTAEFAPPALTARSLGRWGNRIAWRAGDMGERVYTPLIDALRADLGLTPRSRRVYQTRRANTWPVLYGFSQHVVPRPADWRAGLDVTGYWWPADGASWQPPQELVDFLGSGPPPVFVGLGSTATAHGERLSAMIVAALRRAGLRAVIQSGWAGLHGDGSDDVITVADIPHAWLFPRVAAVVHHCGAGTAAAALRAGVPSIPVTGIMDQPFWAARLHALGAATQPLRRSALDTDALSAAITAVIADGRYHERAQQLAQLIGAEDGEDRAVDVVAAHLDRSSRTTSGGT